MGPKAWLASVSLSGERVLIDTGGLGGWGRSPLGCIGLARSRAASVWQKAARLDLVNSCSSGFYKTQFSPYFLKTLKLAPVFPVRLQLASRTHTASGHPASTASRLHSHLSPPQSPRVAPYGLWHPSETRVTALCCPWPL